MSIATAADLKALQTRRTAAKNEADRLLVELNEVKERFNQALAKVADLDKQIENATVKEPIVSEHALLRYCERVLGIDLEVVRNVILTEKVRETLNKLPTVRMTHPDGYRLIVKNRTVVTIE